MEKKVMTVEDVKKQAEISAKEIIEQLKSLVEHGYMTYPELIRILRYTLKKAIDEMCLFRPGATPLLSLKELGLQDLYQALEEMERKEVQEIKKRNNKIG